MKNIQKRYKRFKEWEKQPHQVAPLSPEQHKCATCGTNYEGNYCPRCGQSAKITRYSFKNAFLLYLDVWGLGNRGMFRSIRDLILRPGYMIRDYLRGMQMAYFPPFKMFFLLIALSLLVNTGLNIQGINREKAQEKETKELLESWFKTEEKQADKTSAAKGSEKLSKERDEAEQTLDDMFDKHGSVLELFSLLLFSCPLWLLFRHSPAIPDLRLSECFVAMVYISNMLLIYNIIPLLLCFNLKTEIAYSLLSLLLIIIPIKQLSGYSYWHTIWRILVAIIPFCFMAILLITIAYIVLWCLY